MDATITHDAMDKILTQILSVAGSLSKRSTSATNQLSNEEDDEEEENDEEENEEEFLPDTP